MNLNKEKKQMNKLPEWLQKLRQISPMLARQAETDYIDLKKQIEQLRVEEETTTWDAFLEEVRKKWGESDSAEFDEWLYGQLNEA